MKSRVMKKDVKSRHAAAAGEMSSCSWNAIGGERSGESPLKTACRKDAGDRVGLAIGYREEEFLVLPEGG